MKRILLTAWCYCIASSALAQTAEDLVFQDSGDEVSPRQEKILAAIAANRPGTADPNQPVLMPDLTFVITYGSHQDQTIFCAPLHVCDIALEPGEVVSAVNVGDSVRWTVSPSASMTRVGDIDFEVQHVMIKPADYGLSTNMIITTGRRTYHLILRSEKRRRDADTGQPLPARYMASVSFKYPENAAKTWAAMAQRARRNLVSPTPQSARGTSKPARDGQPRAFAHARQDGGDLTKLSFGYELEGDSPVWKPTRVANDGNKTYIYMPPAMKNGELPVLHIVRDHGGLFTSEDKVLVNAPLRNGVYVVDFVFDEALLVAGVGGNQKSVRIIRK